MGTFFRDKMADALFPRTRQAVLALLIEHPDQTYYLREIIQILGLGVGQVQRELIRLSDADIICRFRQGRHVCFQANPQCAIYDELRSLVTKTVGVVPILASSLSPYAEAISVAFVYGSVARGEEHVASDLDLIVIGSVTFREVVLAVVGAESTLRREIHPTVYPQEEFQRKLADGNHFLRSIMQAKKLFVIGDDDDLGKLA